MARTISIKFGKDPESQKFAGEMMRAMRPPRARKKEGLPMTDTENPLLSEEQLANMRTNELGRSGGGTSVWIRLLNEHAALTKHAEKQKAQLEKVSEVATSLLTAAQTGWESARLIAIQHDAKATEKVADAALGRLSKVQKLLEEVSSGR